METFYLACNLGSEHGQISLGSLNAGRLHVSEIHRFPNPVCDPQAGAQWDAARLHEQMVVGLTKAACMDVPISGVSCTSRGGEYLLFDKDGALVGTSPRDAKRKVEGAGTRWTDELIFEETGAKPAGDTTFLRLCAERPKRLSKAARLLPVADGFNYLLSGRARVEASMASAMQLFNPFERNWSQKVLDVVDLSPALLPEVVSSGTLLGPLQEQWAAATKLEDVQVVSSCSHDVAALVAGLPVADQREWAYLTMGVGATLGMESPFPAADATARQLGFSSAAGCDGQYLLTKPTAGLWIAEGIHRYFAEREDGFDWSVLLHLAASSTPFECFINPADARFRSPGAMPQHVRDFCKETGQVVPRKPGSIMRCALESIALYHRKTLKDFEKLTGRKVERLYLIADETRKAPLLNHFIANALQMPVVVVPSQAVNAGNVMVQAMAFGHVPSLAEARRCIAESFPCETIQPHAQLWNQAFERLSRYVQPAPAKAD
jgi:rhamnulokinase